MADLAGADGIAIAFCADDERPYLRDIEKLTRQKVTPVPLPADFLAEAAKLRKSLPPQALREEPRRDDTRRHFQRRPSGRKPVAGATVHAAGGQRNRGGR